MTCTGKISRKHKSYVFVKFPAWIMDLSIFDCKIGCPSPNCIHYQLDTSLCQESDESIEEITQRMSRLEYSRKQTAGAQEPPPIDQLGDDGNAAHQNKEEDACRDRNHEFQQRTIKHLSAPSRKFYEAVRALHFQLDNPNFTDDVSKQYGDGLLRDVEENYKIVEKAREYCLEVLEPEEQLQKHRTEYLDKKLDEVFICRRIHNKYFELQEEKKRQKQQHQE